MSIRSLAIAMVFALCAASGAAQSTSRDAIDSYLLPYVRSGNFSGALLVEKNGKVIFEKAYGFADREHHLENSTATKFHMASISMQFTAAAVLRLVDAGSLTLDDHVGSYAPGIHEADKITIRDLLTQRSGLPDINALPDYAEVLQHHQTPAGLVAKIDGRPLLFDPGSKFLHEEHSAYNLVALIVEKKTGLPFATAVERLVFQPLGLTASGLDDDSIASNTRMAKGYEPERTYDLQPAPAIHWSAKTGNASVFTTVGDEARWVNALFRGQFLSASSRDAVLDTSLRVGYGWFKSQNKRFGEFAYYMNGRAPGFASFVLYLPQAQLTIVVLSNIYSSATTSIGNDAAALSLGLPYKPFRVRNPPPSPTELKSCTGAFQFDADFYQPNARIDLLSNGSELSLHWPSGEVSPLIPMMDRDHFLDRSYWEEVNIQRDASGRPSILAYGRFQGVALGPQPPAEPAKH